MIILLYVLLFTYCYYIYHIIIRRNTNLVKPQEINKLGNEIIFFSLDKDDANPYHSTISKIECKKKTYYPSWWILISIIIKILPFSWIRYIHKFL